MASLRSRPKQNNLHFTSPASSEKSLESVEHPHQCWLHLQVFKLPYLAVVSLFITIAIGTFSSYWLYSIDHPALPIHQLNGISTSSPVLNHNTHSSLCHPTLPYFARKSNFFNQTFVKFGWAWTSLVVWANLTLFATHYPFPPEQNKEPTKKSDSPKQLTSLHHIRFIPNHLARSISQYCTATVLWIFFTQWFFGNSLFDRVLVLTGAKCIAYCERRWGHTLTGINRSTMSLHRPYWSGGIDISGHVFLLSLSILLILSTLAPSIQILWYSKSSSTTHWIVIYANLTLVASWWWMLLMTSLYFHGPAEKIAALVVGVGTWWISELAANTLIG